METKQGIKEVKEVTAAIMEISVGIAAVLKDGYQASDIAALFKAFAEDEGMKKKLGDAAEGISKVPAELKDLDWNERIELGTIMLQFVPRMIEALRKK